MAFKRLGAEEIDGAVNAVDADIELYVVPADKHAIVATIHCLNRGAVDGVIRVMHTDNGVVEEDYILFDEPLSAVKGNNHISIQLGICMEVGDKLYVRSDVVDVNFQAWGEEGDA